MVQILQKLLHILNKDQKRKVAGLGVMIFIGALMEMIGVGLIMPVVEGVMAPDQLLNKWYIQVLERFIHFDTPNQWLLFLIGVIIAVYFIKNGYLLLQTYVQSRFVNTNQSNTISYMLEEYLNRPYEFYLNADIPTIFRTIDGDVPKVFTTLMEYIQLATELMVSAVLCVTLLVTNPTMTIFIVVVMGGTTVVILKILKPTLNRLGRTSQRLQSQMGKWRLQSIYGINNGDTSLIGFFYNRSHRSCFVSGNNQQIDSLIHKIMDIFRLLTVIVSRRTDLYRNTFIKHRFPKNLIIHFMSPGIVAALCYTNTEMRSILSTRCQPNQTK